MIGKMNHDMGGEPAGKVERTEHDYADWERRVDAINMLCRMGGLYTLDEMRKNIESLPPQAYNEMAYYEKWVSSIAQTLIQRGVITSDELGRKLEEVERRHNAKEAK
jgi:hypothetical protein